MPGVFDLTSPRDLLAKLSRELSRLRAAPNDIDHTFNFFVTAEHLLDWLHPGNTGKAQREAARNTEVLLQLVSHLASGAKHFDHLSPHHQAVADTGRRRSVLPNPILRLLTVGALYGRGPLGVALTGHAATTLGNWISALTLAERVHAYWTTPGRIPN